MLQKEKTQEKPMKGKKTLVFYLLVYFLNSFILGYYPYTVFSNSLSFYFLLDLSYILNSRRIGEMLQTLLLIILVVQLKPKTEKITGFVAISFLIFGGYYLMGFIGFFLRSSIGFFVRILGVCILVLGLTLAQKKSGEIYPSQIVGILVIEIILMSAQFEIIGLFKDGIPYISDRESRILGFGTLLQLLGMILSIVFLPSIFYATSDELRAQLEKLKKRKEIPFGSQSLVYDQKIPKENLQETMIIPSSPTHSPVIQDPRYEKLFNLLSMSQEIEIHDIVQYLQLNSKPELLDLLIQWKPDLPDFTIVSEKIVLQQAKEIQNSGIKNRITTALLAIFLGDFGIHHFYIGNSRSGVIFLIFFWSGIPGLISLIQGIQFLLMSDKEFTLYIQKKATMP